MRARIYRWYTKLRVLDPEKHKEETADRLQEYLVKLDRIEENVSNIAVPLSFSEELYHLRMHIDMMRSKLIQIIEIDKMNRRVLEWTKASNLSACWSLL